jgi:glutaminase
MLDIPLKTARAPADGGRLESPVQRYLERLHARYAALDDGVVATYIPELARANPQWFGVAVATTDGHVYEAGDTRQPFTIQSISKALTYGLALEDRGLDTVLTRIGVEPTGEAFNSISLAPDTGRPLNPMINAGAIAATALVAGRSFDDRLARLLAVYSLYAGRALAIDEAVYTSESVTGHRNRAIGYMLRNFDIIDGDPGPALDLYFRQCSVAVDCRDLALIAATLANGGVNPVTQERAVRAGYVERILSVMTTCGMYDSAGEWMYSVGLPAKSGVSGGVMVVLPGQLGIGVYSPPLDIHGNSVRGVRVCQDLSRECELHVARVARSARSAIRAHYTLGAVRSKRIRPDGENEALARLGHRAVVYELQGDLLFAAMEAVVRTVVGRGEVARIAVLDMNRVTSVPETATRMLLELIECMESGGGRIVLVGVHEKHRRLLRFLQEHTAGQADRSRVLAFSNLDLALEWCESRLLDGAPGHRDPPECVSLADHSLCEGLDVAAVCELDAALEQRTYSAGEYILRSGADARAIYLLMRGDVSVTVLLANGQPRRLATLSAGMTFGERAALESAERSADVRANTAVECRVLTVATLERLASEQPAIGLAIMRNLLRNAMHTVDRLSREVAALTA